MDLDTMSYADLRRLAKSVGLKANMKAEKLLQALKRHFEQQENSVNGNSVNSDDGPVSEKAAAEPEPATDALVTTRRRKKQQAKRKYSGDSADPNPPPAQSPVQDDAQQTREEVDGGKRSSKRRKVSLAKDTEAPAPEEKPEAVADDAITDESQKDVVKKTAGKIPRHEGLMKKKAALRPTTPNFRKLHEAHFSKMESIDSYVQRKSKQKEVLQNSVKDLKKPPVSRAPLFSPGVLEKKAQRVTVTQAPASKPMLKDGASFRPSILSANRINVRFSQTTVDNEHKRSLVKTPARMSPMPSLTPTPGRKSGVQANKKPTSVNKTPGATPFIFSGSCSTPPTNKKNVFDLKASLNRPLTYKPHKGKLKPFGTMQENEPQVNKSQTLPTRTNFKQHKVQTRDERRAKHVEDRKQKKEKLLGARRGLVSA